MGVVDCAECRADEVEYAFIRRLERFSERLDGDLTGCVLYKYLDRWDRIRGWCAHRSLGMLASVNKTFALRIASVNEESLAHVGVRHARRLSIESGGCIGPTSSRMGVCKGFCHMLTALCPCGCCVECILHGYMLSQEVDTRAALDVTLPCVCAMGTCPVGIMWCVKARRVQQAVGGEQQRDMYREYFNSNAYSDGGSRTDTSVRSVQFRPDCVKRIHPDNYDPEELRGYRPLEALRRVLIAAVEAARVSMSAPLGPHG